MARKPPCLAIILLATQYLTSSFKTASSFILPSSTTRQGMAAPTTSATSTMPLEFSSQDATASSTVETSEGEKEEGGICGIIFDIDGTLADSWNLGYQATLTVLSNYNNNHMSDQEGGEVTTPSTYPLSTEEYHYGCRFTTPERLARHVGLEPGQESFEEVGNMLGKEFDDYYVKLVDQSTAKFYSGISSLLVKFHSGSYAGNADSGSDRGMQLGALTNACVDYAHAVLKANCPDHSSVTSSSGDSSIYSRFTSIQGADSVPRPKPHGDGILQVCNEMNLKPTQVVYVGDAPTDAKAALNAQCRAAIGVLWGSNSKEQLEGVGFDKLCETVEELEEAIMGYL